MKNIRITTWVMALATAALITGCSGDSDSDPVRRADSTVASVAAAAIPTPSPDPVYVTPDKGLFTIKLRTTERQCFGSAGCNVTVEPDVTYLGLTDDLDPDAVYEITYEIHGDESGPVIDTMELSDQSQLTFSPSMVSTISSGTRLTVQITDVISR